MFALAAAALLAISTSYPPGFDVYFGVPVDAAGAINEAEDWLRANYRDEARAASRLISSWIQTLEDFLTSRPWPVIVLCFAGLGQVVGGWKLALLSLISVLSWAVLRQWDASLQTLSLMGVSVAISLIVGFPIGVLAGTNRIARGLISPLLDAMQTMPAFVYLVPAIFFFGVGATTAVMATFIYALPPIIRLTSHGLLSTPASMIEVANSFGASRWQSFVRVRLPHALGAVFVGINQTIMMALGLVVLAAMVGAPGLGSEIWLALQKLNIGKALEGGLCIVFMAIVFDRLVGSSTASREPAHPGGSPSGKRSTATRMLTIGVGLVGLVLLDLGLRAAGMFIHFPKPLEINIASPVNDFVDWLVSLPWLYQATHTITWFIYSFLLNPLQIGLLTLPFWALTAALIAVGAWLGRWQLALLSAVTCLVLGATGALGAINADARVRHRVDPHLRDHWNPAGDLGRPE